MTTTHPDCRDFQQDQVKWAYDLDRDGMFDSLDFVGLQVLDDNDGDKGNKNEAYLTFQVTLRERAGEKQETVIQETSRFLRDPVAQTWTYAGGDVRSQVAGLEDTKLNP